MRRASIHTRAQNASDAAAQVIFCFCHFFSLRHQRGHLWMGGRGFHQATRNNVRMAGGAVCGLYCKVFSECSVFQVLISTLVKPDVSLMWFWVYRLP